ncbi:UDP-glucosyltransferase 2-like [Athalia rosae]|uniref:UDP-glucosyltransferase 2-like n=1 Tax=Athalia rosae TaxID=37344 RepID=UPI00203321C0|nr:UDP-glucosyltransferase 2-like [Athalia rosae]
MQSLLSFVVFMVLSMISQPSTEALRILGLNSVASLSHHIWFTELMRGLARNGHEIYSIDFWPAQFEKDDAISENRTTSFVFDNVGETFWKSHDLGEWFHAGFLETIFRMHQVSNEFCECMMHTEGAKRVLELVRNTRIDVIVQDITLGQCFYVLQEVAVGHPPLVGFTPLGLPVWVTDIVGGNDWPAIKSHPYNHRTPPFTFWERIENAIYHKIEHLLRRYDHLPIQQKIGEKFIGQKLERSIEEIEKGITFVLTNSYPTMDAGIFLPPNVVEVGGLHITDPKPLPQDMKTFLDNAEHGAIIVSFGTNVKTNTLSLEKLHNIVSAMSQLKQRVLWKFDDDYLPEQPKNVMIRKWLPQSDILAHPNVRVFWGHGGLLSSQEAVWRGIPFVGTAFFLDQPTVINQLVKKGVALRIDSNSLTTEKILKTLNKILTDQSFSTLMEKLSREFRDRLSSPIETAIWHIEHSFRHPQGPLSSPGRNMSWVQLNLIDFYAVLLTIFLLILWIFGLLLRASIRTCSLHAAKRVESKVKYN